ncbi:MAG: hypothetical protein KDD47_20005, partial [Acidobacteria bacterium]|nr:hypothetical protein [Acidobacteriota bacterium]
MLIPAQQPPAAAATAHGALAAVAGVESGILVGIAAAAALGPAVETQTTGVAVPGAAHDAEENERR